MLFPVILFLLALIIFIFLLLNTYILLEYVRKDQEDNAVLSVFTAWGLLKYKYDIPFINLTPGGIESRMSKRKGKKEKKVEEGKKKFGIKEFIERYRYFSDFRKHNYGAVRYLRKKLKLKQFDLSMLIGTGDAYWTSILTGVAWAVTGIFLSILSDERSMSREKVSIKSTFVEKNFKVDLYCIFHIKNVHIIVVVLKLLASRLVRAIRTKKVLGGDVSG